MAMIEIVVMYRLAKEKEENKLNLDNAILILLKVTIYRWV